MASDYRGYRQTGDRVVYDSIATRRYKSQYLRYVRSGVLAPSYFGRGEGTTVAQYPSGRSPTGVWTAGIVYEESASGGGGQPLDPYLPNFNPSSPQGADSTIAPPNNFQPPDTFEWPTQPFVLYAWWQSHGRNGPQQSISGEYVIDSFTDECRLASDYLLNDLRAGSVSRAIVGWIYPPVIMVEFQTGPEVSPVYYVDDQCANPRSEFVHSQLVPTYATWRVVVHYAGNGGGVRGARSSVTFPRFICFEFDGQRLGQSGGGTGGGGGGPDPDPPVPPEDDECRILSWNCNCPDYVESHGAHGGPFPSQQRDRSWVGSGAGVDDQGHPQWCKHIFDLAQRTCPGNNYDPRQLERPEPPPDELTQWFGAPTGNDPPGGWGQWLADRRREQREEEYEKLQQDQDNQWAEVTDIWDNFNAKTPDEKADVYRAQQLLAEEEFLVLQNYPATEAGLLQFRDDVQAGGNPYLVDEWLRQRLSLPPVEQEYNQYEESTGDNPEPGDFLVDDQGILWEVVN